MSAYPRTSASKPDVGATASAARPQLSPRLRMITRSFTSSAIATDKQMPSALHATLSPTSSPFTLTFFQQPITQARSTKSSASIPSFVRSTSSDSMDDTDFEIEMAQTPVPGFTRSSSHCSESESSMGSGSEADEEDGEGETDIQEDVKIDLRTDSGAEDADISNVRKGLATFAFPAPIQKVSQGTLPLPQPTYIRIARHHAKPYTITKPATHQQLPHAQPPIFRRGESYPPIFKHEGRIYVNSSKIEELRARKAMASASASGTLSASNGIGGADGAQGRATQSRGVGPMRNIGSGISRGRTMSAGSITGRYEICTEPRGGHAQLCQLEASSLGPAGCALPTLHFKRSSGSASPSHPYRLNLAIPTQAGLASPDLTTFRFPAPSAPPGYTQQQRLPSMVHGSSATDRRLLLIGPAVANHLKSGGSVRIRDMEGSIIGMLA